MARETAVRMALSAELLDFGEDRSLLKRRSSGCGRMGL